MGFVHSLSDQKKNFGRCKYIIKELPLLFMSVLPREIYHPGPFPIWDMRNGQNRESGNRGSGCSGGFRSFRNDPSEYPGWFKVPQNDWSCPNLNSGIRKLSFGNFLIQFSALENWIRRSCVLIPTPFGASMPCGAGSSKSHFGPQTVRNP